MDVENHAAALGGAASGGAVLLWLTSKVFKAFIGDITENKKNQAESALYENLRNQINEMGEDISSIKEDHKKEKQELESRITQLEDAIHSLSQRYRHNQMLALEAYGFVSRVCDSTIGCQQENMTSIRDILIKIIENNPKIIENNPEKQ
jgi:signal transduction histidine kinase